MDRLPHVAALSEAASGAGFFLCLRKDVRLDRNGGTFLSVVLQDRSGTIQGRVFHDADAMQHEFEAGEFVKIEARAERHRQRLELVVDRIRRVHPEQDRAEGFREDDCIPSASRSAEEMWAELVARVAGVQDPWIRQLMERVLEQHGPRLRTWPAAQMVHHACRGGLLEHILKMAEVGSAIAAAYGVDADLVVAGAVLHDIGKLEELTSDPAVAYSREGNLLGHITLGVLLVRDATRGIPGFPGELRARLEHMIVSHHGARDLGSPVEPMTPEAFILSAVDGLDATLHQLRTHYEEDRGEGAFTAYHPRLKRVLLKPSGR